MTVCPLNLAISMGLEPCKTKLGYVHSHATAIHVLEDGSNLESEIDIGSIFQKCGHYIFVSILRGNVERSSTTLYMRW